MTDCAEAATSRVDVDAVYLLVYRAAHFELDKGTTWDAGRVAAFAYRIAKHVAGSVDVNVMSGVVPPPPEVSK